MLDSRSEAEIWAQQSWSAPSLGCSKKLLIPFTTELLNLLQENPEVDPGSKPDSKLAVSPQIWRRNIHALTLMGLVEKSSKSAILSENGRQFLTTGDSSIIADNIAARTRLFSEILDRLALEPQTTETLHEDLVTAYDLDWKSDANTRLRIAWLEALGLVEWLAERRLGLTALGQKKLKIWPVVSPEGSRASNSPTHGPINQAPQAIQLLLDELDQNPKGHESRSTHNIFLPSPPSAPNKIENLREIVLAASESIAREELITFISEQFAIKPSSVESMFPFLRWAGFIQEVRRGVFSATPGALAWLESNSPFDFVRIMHANVLFIGELLESARPGINRNDLYGRGQVYGLNKEKVRWRLSLMIDAGMVFETNWTTVRTSPEGLALLQTLSLKRPKTEENIADRELPESSEKTSGLSAVKFLVENLIRSSTDPLADDLPSGSAFEKYIAESFRQMGFLANVISGAGDTDVLVEWADESGKAFTAIVDGKSTSSGRIAHTNISELAIDAHKDKNGADFVAIVAPGFSGKTITTMAEKRAWVLLTAGELAQVVEAQATLALEPQEVALIFQGAKGLSKLGEKIEAKTREKEIVTLVISRLNHETQSGESFSARDISLIERASDLAPTTAEIVEGIEFLRSAAPGAILLVEESQDPKYSTYRIGNAALAARRLRSSASAIENGLGANHQG